MNDRNVLERALVRSPGFLLQELGLNRLLLFRPRGPIERSREVSLLELDSEIANRGRAWILQPTLNGFALLRLQDEEKNTYKCLFVEFDYTAGEYFFGATRNRGRRVFDLPLAHFRELRLLPTRPRDVMLSP